MFNKMQAVWRLVRRLSGDDAYEQYLLHHTQHHSDDDAPLTKAKFFKQWQDGKWNGIKRCC